MAKDQDQQERKKSSVDRANEIIEKGRSTYQKTKQLKKLYNIVKAGRVVSTAASTAEVWIPILVVIIIIVLILIVIITLFGGTEENPVEAQAGTCTSVAGAVCSPVGSMPKCPSGTEEDTSGASCSDTVDPATGATISYVCCTPSVTGGSDILYWGVSINNAIVSALGCSNPRYNRQQQLITNGVYSAARRAGTCSGLGSATYFCTNLIRDALNLAGIKNTLSEYTPSMVNGWNSVPGLTLTTRNDTRILRPGDALFWHGYSSSCDCYRYRHADMLYSISVDSSTGNGYIITIDANVTVKRVKSYVRGFRVLGTAWIPPADGIAFGLTPR